MLKGAIFDMDGVLVDNLRVHTDAFVEIGRRYGVEVDVPHFLSLSGKGNKEIFDELFPPDVVARVGWWQLGVEKEKIYRELYVENLRPAEGLVALLDRFKATGVKMAVGSSAIQMNVDFVLDGLGIRHYFDAIVCADKVRRTKPDPEIYLLCLSELGLAAQDCLVFEDAVAGIVSARAAGIRVVALSTTEPVDVLQAQEGVVSVIRDFRELKIENFF